MFGFCLLTTLAMIYVKRRSALPPDTLIGVFLALSLGLGLCLLVLVTREFNVHQVESVLFGSLLTVTDADLLLLLAVGVSVIALLVREYNHLLLDSLSPPLGSVSGADPRYLDYFFAFLLAVSIVASLKIIGALLVEALIIVPAAAARNVARGTRTYLVWSVAIAFLAGVGGLGLSTKFQVPTGPAVVLGASLMFFGTLIAGSFGRVGRVGLARLVTGRRAAGLAIIAVGVAIAAVSAGAPRGTVIGILLISAGAYFFKFGWPGGGA